MENYESNDEGLNSFLIYDLVELKAVEHIDLIEKAFASERVDKFVMGDFEDVQVELGLIEKRTKPKQRLRWLDHFGQKTDGQMVPSERNSKKVEKKEKKKSKQEKKARKKNRKKK